MLSPLMQQAEAPAVSLAGLPHDDELGPQFEALARRLCSAFRDTASPGCTVGITSCAQGEGVSTVACNLAAYATHVVGSAVLLLEANVEDPSIADRIGIPASPGFVEALSNPEQWTNCIHRSRIPNVWCMPAGKITRQIRHMARLTGLPAVLESLRSRFPFIVVDLPPAAESMFGLAVAECLDGVLLVLEAERMRVQVVERAKQLFEQSRVNLLGAVLNKRQMHIPSWLYSRL